MFPPFRDLVWRLSSGAFEKILLPVEQPTSPRAHLESPRKEEEQLDAATLGGHEGPLLIT